MLTVNCSTLVNVVGKVTTSRQVEAMMADDELSNFTDICPTVNPAGGGLLDPVMYRSRCSRSVRENDGMSYMVVLISLLSLYNSYLVPTVDLRVKQQLM